WKLADLAATNRSENRPSALMMSSVIPSLKKSWPGSGDRLRKGKTATVVRSAKRAGVARFATIAAWDAAPKPEIRDAGMYPRVHAAIAAIKAKPAIPAAIGSRRSQGRRRLGGVQGS